MRPELKARCRMLLPALALAVSACQSTDDGPASVTNSWNAAPLTRPDVVEPPRRSGQRGAPLLDNVARGRTTYVEGTGRFIGDTPVGSA